MLFWLFIIIGIVGVGLYRLGCRDWDFDKQHWMWYHSDKFEVGGAVLFFIAIIAIVISLLCICGNFMGIDADVAKYHEKYEALTYKMESGACRDEFGLLSKEVIDEIQYWNTDLTYRQNIQDDFWLGIFYPNVYGQFKTIDYESYNRE